MTKVVSIHEYELKPGVDGKAFEAAVHKAREDGLLKLEGLENFYLLKGIRGDRASKYAAVWVYESLEVWESLWGPVGDAVIKEDYPENWKKWEDEVLAQFLVTDPDEIPFSSYEAL